MSKLSQETKLDGKTPGFMYLNRLLNWGIGSGREWTIAHRDDRMERESPMERGEWIQPLVIGPVKAGRNFSIGCGVLLGLTGLGNGPGHP